jgi:chemotaxis protein CheX
MTDTLITDDQLWQLVESIWGTMLCLDVSREDGGDVAPTAGRLAASVEIGGGYQGRVLFLTSERFARRATARLLAVPEGSVSPADIDDAVGELCNILGGGVKSLFPAPSWLSLPNVMHGWQPAAAAARSQVTAGLCFTCEGQPLEVRVLQEPTNAHSGASLL